MLCTQTAFAPIASKQTFAPFSTDEKTCVIALPFAHCRLCLLLVHKHDGSPVMGVAPLRTPAFRVETKRAGQLKRKQEREAAPSYSNTAANVNGAGYSNAAAHANVAACGAGLGASALMPQPPLMVPYGFQPSASSNMHSWASTAAVPAAQSMAWKRARLAPQPAPVDPILQQQARNFVSVCLRLHNAV